MVEDRLQAALHVGQCVVDADHDIHVGLVALHGSPSRETVDPDQLTPERGAGPQPKAPQNRPRLKPKLLPGPPEKTG